jgi:hypothetical protein
MKLRPRFRRPVGLLLSLIVLSFASLTVGLAGPTHLLQPENLRSSAQTSQLPTETVSSYTNHLRAHVSHVAVMQMDYGESSSGPQTLQRTEAAEHVLDTEAKELPSSTQLSENHWVADRRTSTILNVFAPVPDLTDQVQTDIKRFASLEVTSIRNVLTSAVTGSAPHMKATDTGRASFPKKLASHQFPTSAFSHTEGSINSHETAYMAAVAAKPSHTSLESPISCRDNLIQATLNRLERLTVLLSSQTVSSVTTRAGDRKQSIESYLAATDRPNTMGLHTTMLSTSSTVPHSGNRPALLSQPDQPHGAYHHLITPKSHPGSDSLQGHSVPADQLMPRFLQDASTTGTSPLVIAREQRGMLRNPSS